MNIAIASGKGGTGKTTLSVNLASYLAEKMKITLVDLDVEEPNSGIFIDTTSHKSEIQYKKIPEWKQSKCTFCGKCQEVCNFHAVLNLASQIMIFPELCHSCHACSELCPTAALPMKDVRMGSINSSLNGNLFFVESRLDIGQEQAVPMIASTFDFLKKEGYPSDINLLDSPPGTSCPVIEVAQKADSVILVTEPTPFGLNDLKLAVETMRELSKEVAVVINRFGIGNNDVIDYCESESIPIIAKIPNSRTIAGIYSKGKLIYPEVPEFKEEMEKVASYVLNLSMQKK